MIASARALLALIMLAALYIFTFVLVALYLFLWFLVMRHPETPFRTVLMLLASTPFLANLVRAVTTRMAVGPRLDSVLVRPEQAPRLWNTVRELAEQVGTRAPAEIRLVAEANASVTEDVRLLGLLPGHKRMYIGAPLLVGMPAEELRAVLCHELGHYAHEHARFAVPAYRGSAALAAALQGMGRRLSANPLVDYLYRLGFGWL
jgi:Zn-dependent protease with chaperone function